MESFISPSMQETLAEFAIAAAHATKPASYSDHVALGAIALGSAAMLLRGKLWDKPDPYHHLWFERPQLQAGGQASAKAETRNIAKKLAEQNKNLVIFWGSQSGTAEGFANRLARDCHQRFGLEAMTADLSDYDPETISEIPETVLSIFIVSTYGEGDPSDNTATFWDWVQKTDASLSKMRYMAFGLGNTNYKYYNRVVDVMIAALDKLGATALMPVGKADDAQGATQEDFITWKDDVFDVFRKDLGCEEREGAFEASIAVVEDSSLEPIDLHHGEPVHPHASPKTVSPISALKIQNTRELFTSTTRNCIHMELDLSEFPEMRYKTGDHLAVWPTNPDNEVNTLLRLFGFAENPQNPIHVNSLDQSVKVKVPSPTTPDSLFRYYLEICAPVSRDTILGLSYFAPTSSAKDFLRNLGQNRSEFAALVSTTHLTVGRLLDLSLANSPQATTWSASALAFLIELLPTIQPRYYSISSSSTLSPRAPSITALVSNTPLSAAPSVTIPGVASNYLLALSQQSSNPQSVDKNPKSQMYDLAGPNGVLAAGTKLHAHIRRSKFKLPMLGSTPIVMVAAGTGIAPFRAFVAERVRLHAIGKPVGEMLLFFGCRNPEEDFIYREELEEARKALGDKFRIVTAFSRVEGEAKRYVQDEVEKYGEDVARVMGDGGNFYICGRASMAREVGKRVEEVIGKMNGWGDQESREWGEGAKRRAKWQEDVWG